VIERTDPNTHPMAQTLLRTTSDDPRGEDEEDVNMEAFCFDKRIVLLIW
jgi:hypothetical protein